MKSLSLLKGVGCVVLGVALTLGYNYICDGKKEEQQSEEGWFKGTRLTSGEKDTEEFIDVDFAVKIIKEGGEKEND